MRLGIEDGLDPMSAAQRAAADAAEGAARRGRADRRSGCAASTTRTSGASTRSSPRRSIRCSSSSTTSGGGCEADGVRNVPAHGRALLVANHAGSLFPFDASMILGAIMKEHPLPRWARFMVLDWAFVLPFRRTFMRRVGGVPASPHNAARLLEQDELVMVFPEGVKGTGKPFSERYRLQRFGRGGFVEVALRTGAPIVPVAVVGSEEIYPKLADAKPLARAIGAPVRSDHADLSVARPAGAGPAAVEVADRVLRADRPLRARPRRRRGPAAPVRRLRAGAGDDPGEALREPGQAGLGVPVAAAAG